MHPSAHPSCTHQPHSAVAHTRTKLFSSVCRCCRWRRLLGNQTIIPSPQCCAIPFHIPLSHRACVGNTIAATSHVAHTRDHILLSHAFGTPWAIGFGKHAASCYHLDATQARQGLLKTGPRIGLGKVSGMLLEKAGFDLPQASRQAKCGQTTFALSADHSIDPRSAARASDFLSADLARYRAARTKLVPSASYSCVGKWLVPVSTWWEKGRAVFVYHVVANDINLLF